MPPNPVISRRWIRWSWAWRERQAVADRPGPPRFDGVLTLPILIHGDAAFPGQGIVAETLNLSRLSGYDTSGTIHIIANNQLGFTATPDESYSTSYASGLARGFKIPSSTSTPTIRRPARGRDWRGNTARASVSTS